MEKANKACVVKILASCSRTAILDGFTIDLKPGLLCPLFTIVETTVAGQCRESDLPDRVEVLRCLIAYPAVEVPTYLRLHIPA
eukprot:scaffold92180_cov16-Tisochrysis_lutea.AAC.1